MSERIDEILEVVEHITILSGARTREGAAIPIPAVRNIAVRMVAAERGIDHTTVSDKFRRQLYPHIDGTSAFDEAVADWLRGRDRTLEAALLRHAVSDEDLARIREFFR